jgi:hypothetical protein
MSISAEAKFKWAIKDAWAKGIYPGPTFLNALIHNRRSDNLNSRETMWRREVMHELKIPLKRPKGSRAAKRQMTGRPRAIEPKILCCMNTPGCRCCA